MILRSSSTASENEGGLDQRHQITATLTALREYGTLHQHEINGLSHAGPIATMWSLLDHQAVRGIRGNVLEIGVLEGRTFFLLCAGLAPGELAIAVDLFQNEDRKRAFVSTLKRLVTDTNAVRVCAGSSTAFAEKNETQTLEKTVRFIHVDGSHEYDDVRCDLRLADRLLKSDGVVVCDDFFNPLCPAVTQAIADHLDAGSPLVPFAIAIATGPVTKGCHKLFLCHREAVSDYARSLGIFLGDHLVKRQKWWNVEVDVLSFDRGVRKLDPLAQS